MKICKAAIAAIMALPIGAAAQEADSVLSGRVTTAAYMIGAGRTRVLDTYLSQEHFAGPGFTFLASIERQRPGSRWLTAMQHQANIALADDRASQASELEGSYNFYWGRYYSWQLLSDRLTLK